MRVLLLRLEIQCCCIGRQEASTAKTAWGLQNLAPKSQTLIVWSADPDTIVFPSGEKATDMTQLLCAALFALFNSSVAAREGTRGQMRPYRGNLGPKNAPESQTLMLLSSEPDTIVFPSGEKSTEVIMLLCALVFSLFSSSVSAWKRGASQF